MRNLDLLQLFLPVWILLWDLSQGLNGPHSEFCEDLIPNLPDGFEGVLGL
jgi:hypothetical protein